MDADAVAADRFLKSIGVRFEPKPPAAPSKAPEPQPQAPAETKPVDRQAEFAKRYDDELGGIVELLMHPEFFSETGDDVTVANAVRVFEWVHRQGKYVSRATVNEAVKALKKELVPLRQQPEPVSPQPPSVVRQIDKTSIPPTKTAPVAPPLDPEAGLPPLPPYVVRTLGSNKMQTMKDVRAIPTSIFSDLYRGPHAQAFKNRIDALVHRKT